MQCASTCRRLAAEGTNLYYSFTPALLLLCSYSSCVCGCMYVCMSIVPTALLLYLKCNIYIYIYYVYISVCRVVELMVERERARRSELCD
jgi:hypothetical protein